MKSNQLSDNGIEKLICNVSNLILQVLSVQKKMKNQKAFYSCELSDGYSKLKGCLILDPEIQTQGKLIQDFLVIELKRLFIQKKVTGEIVSIVENYKIVSEKVKKKIGDPILHDDFLKNGKKNPSGDNVYEEEETQNAEEIAKIKLYKDLLEDDEDEETICHPISIKNEKNNKKEKLSVKEKVNDKKQSKQPVSKRGLRLSDEQEIQKKPKQNNPRQNNGDNSRSTSLNINKMNNHTSKNASNSPVARNKSVGAKNKSTGAIEKVDIKASPVGKGIQNKSHHGHNLIKDLYHGMQNFVVLVRILFIYPVKKFINKKGIESSLMNMTVGDKSGIIDCTMFGETVQKFQGRLREEQVLELSQASVIEDTYLDKKGIKISLRQRSKVSLMQEDNIEVPYSEDFCTSPSQLVKAPLNTSHIVICLVKDTEKVIQFTTKKGILMKKKKIYLCDPQEKIQVELDILGDRCNDNYQNCPYMIKGVNIGEFNGNRQYGLKGSVAIRPMKHHPWRRYVKDFENISFNNPDSNKKRRGTSNFQQLMTAMDEINDKGLWSEHVCSINTFNTRQKPYYQACPHCNKKVTSQKGQCSSCTKDYDQTIKKFMTNFALADMFDTVWATGFDQVSQDILGITAQQYSQKSEEEIQELVKDLRYREFKLKLVTKTDVFNNQQKKKTNVIKKMEFNYAEQAKNILNKLQHLVGQ